MLSPGSADDDGTRKRIVVCGDDPLAFRLVDELHTRYAADVTAIISSRRRNHGPDIVQLLGPGRVVESERLDLDAFRAARVQDAVALALIKQDDVGNIHAALQAQELNPQLQLVLRMFNMSLGLSIVKLFGQCRVLSDASMAAPAFVSAALGETAPVHVRLAHRTLYVARRADVRDDEIMAGLAAGTELLPTDSATADLVLAVATGAPAQTTRVRKRRRNPLATLRGLISRKLWLATAALVALLVFGSGLLSVVNEDLTWLNAAYLTVLAALGGADPDVNASAPEKMIQTVLSVASIALIPVLTAAVVETVVNARLAIALGRLKDPVEDHVVVVGLGNVGTRVIRRLHELGVPVVAIDRIDTALGAQTARANGIPLVIGDASRLETLEAASVQTARALVVASTDDVVNLEAALQARVLKPDLRVCLRLYDGDFADRVQRAFGITTSHSVSYLAAPAFAAALLERSVVGTVPVGRRVVLLAEVDVKAGATLDGATVAHANHPGHVRVIALTTDGGKQTVWRPPDGHLLRPGDQLLAVTTRLGLGRLLGQGDQDHSDLSG